MKSYTFQSAVSCSLPTTGTCRQNKARSGVQRRAKSVQSVRVLFSRGKTKGHFIRAVRAAPLDCFREAFLLSRTAGLFPPLSDLI
jgi:hypothetical protein